MDAQREGLATHTQPFGTPRQRLPEKQVNFLKTKGITFVRHLGNSTYGDVWELKEMSTKWKEHYKFAMNRPLVCKILTSKTNAIPSLVKDSNLYSELNHLHIIKRIDVYYVPDEKSLRVFAFMGLMDGNLNDLIENGLATKDPEQFTHKWAKQILSGLKYLHELNISHLDIKPSNILYIIDKDPQIGGITFKLTDFGLPFKFEAKHSGNRIDVHSAPELFSGDCNTKKADIYSMGVTMAESIGSGRTSLDQVMDKIRNFDKRETTGLEVSQHCAHLIASMIETDPNLRPIIVGVVGDMWVKHFFREG